MFNGSEAGSFLRLIDFVYQSTLGSRVMKKKKSERLIKKKREDLVDPAAANALCEHRIRHLGFHCYLS